MVMESWCRDLMYVNMRLTLVIAIIRCLHIHMQGRTRQHSVADEVLMDKQSKGPRVCSDSWMEEAGSAQAEPVDYHGLPDY